jgi:hypothetical protein
MYTVNKTKNIVEFICRSGVTSAGETSRDIYGLEDDCHISTFLEIV